MSQLSTNITSTAKKQSDVAARVTNRNGASNACLSPQRSSSVVQDYINSEEAQGDEIFNYYSLAGC